LLQVALTQFAVRYAIRIHQTSNIFFVLLHTTDTHGNKAAYVLRSKYS